jgi:hypothetical protein
MYTDLSGSYFHYRDLVSWQWFDAMAENDAYDRIPAGSVKTFFQAAAPTGWTQVTTQTDKMLRVVSGAGGGSGGAVGIASGFSLAHTHAVAAHHHTQPAHNHQLDYSAISVANSNNIMRTSNADGSGDMQVPSTGNPYRVFSATGLNGGGADTSDATPGTDSQLATVTLAYIDLILASKD